MNSPKLVSTGTEGKLHPAVGWRDEACVQLSPSSPAPGALPWIVSLVGPHLQSAGPVPGAAGPALGWTGQSRNRSSQSNGVNILRQEVPAMQKKAKMMETAT